MPLTPSIRSASGLEAGFGYTFESPGTYTYHCIIPPYMRGQVTVTEASTQAVTADFSDLCQRSNLI
jgi:hypothetical protein